MPKPGAEGHGNVAGIELSLGDEDAAKLRSIAQIASGAGESGLHECGYCWPIGEGHRFLQLVGRSDGIIGRSARARH
jgi:hypothetical protein